MFKSIINFLHYRDVIKKNTDILYKEYGVKVDMIYRLYTVYTVDETEFLQYGDQLVVSNFNEYKKKLERFLIKNGLSELYDVYIQDRVNARQYKLGIRYKLLDTLFWANVLTVAFISLFTGVGFGIIVYLFFKIFKL